MDPAVLSDSGRRNNLLIVSDISIIVVEKPPGYSEPEATEWLRMPGCLVKHLCIVNKGPGIFITEKETKRLHLEGDEDIHPGIWLLTECILQMKLSGYRLVCVGQESAVHPEVETDIQIEFLFEQFSGVVQTVFGEPFREVQHITAVRLLKSQCVVEVEVSDPDIFLHDELCNLKRGRGLRG